MSSVPTVKKFQPSKKSGPSYLVSRLYVWNAWLVKSSKDSGHNRRKETMFNRDLYSNNQKMIKENNKTKRKLAQAQAYRYTFISHFLPATACDLSMRTPLGSTFHDEVRHLNPNMLSYEERKKELHRYSNVISMRLLLFCTFIVSDILLR
jgi:hypothetical protein